MSAAADPVSGYKIQVFTFLPSDVATVDALDRSGGHPGSLQGASREPTEALQEPSWGTPSWEHPGAGGGGGT